MGKSKEFEILKQMLDANPDLTAEALADMTNNSNEKEACNAFALLAGWHYRDGQLDKAMEVMDKAKQSFTFLPIPLLSLRTHLRQLMGDVEMVAEEYLDYGTKAIDLGLQELGLEALSTALVVDISKGYHRLLHNTDKLLTITERYEEIAAAMQRPSRNSVTTENGDRLRVGMIVPNMVDNTVAYSNRVMFFSRFIDRSRFSLNVYITENTILNSYHLPITFKSPPTSKRAQKYLKELTDREVPVYLPNINTSIKERASQIAQKITDDNIDILILQAGPSMPIDWLACRLANVPVKFQIHIGLSSYQKDVDATLFDNSVNMERERDAWPNYAGEMKLMRRGTDIVRIDRIQKASRSKLGIPEDAILVGTLSNHLLTRMSDSCFTAICKALKSEPKAFYAGIGASGNCSRLENIADQEGVADRVKFFPSTRTPAPLLKMLDVYTNEFPSGGSQSVVEAMACGLPVVALRAGNTHHESVGCDIVGKPYAIDEYNVDAYQELLTHWLHDTPSRLEAGKRMRKRAEVEFSIRTYVKNICDLGERSLNEKQKDQLAII